MGSGYRADLLDRHHRDQPARSDRGRLRLLDARLQASATIFLMRESDQQRRIAAQQRLSGRRRKGAGADRRADRPGARALLWRHDLLHGDARRSRGVVRLGGHYSDFRPTISCPGFRSACWPICAGAHVELMGIDIVGARDDRRQFAERARQGAATTACRCRARSVRDATSNRIDLSLRSPVPARSTQQRDGLVRARGNVRRGRRRGPSPARHSSPAAATSSTATTATPTSTAAQRLALPITFIHGAKNACFKPESTERTLARLSEANGKQLYERHVIPGPGTSTASSARTPRSMCSSRIVAHLDKTATI